MNSNDMKKSDTTWFRQAKWGVMLHYLADIPSTKGKITLEVDEWNRMVDSVDVDDLAKTIAQTGAGYILFTLGQNSGFFCSPNKAYDEITGIIPSKLSNRDLIADLAKACQNYGIHLLAYLPSHGPAKDIIACENLGFTPRWDPSQWKLSKDIYTIADDIDDRLTKAQTHWEIIIREWSERWMDLVKGWWFDGCYYFDRMYGHSSAPNLKSFIAAAKSGNPDALVAFNTGVGYPPINSTPYADYTAGEVNELAVGNKFSPFESNIGGAQLHILTFLGEYWRSGKPRLTDGLAIEYTSYINDCSGVVTWDVPISSEGKIPQEFIAQLTRIGLKC